MSQLANIANEPITYAIGKQEFKFSPMKLGDLGAFEAVVRNRRIRLAQEHLKDFTLSSSEKHQLISQALKGTISMWELQQEMITPSGVSYLLWKSASKNHPDLKQDEFADMLDFNKMEELTALMDALFGKTEEDEDVIPPAEAVEEAEAG